MKPYGERPYSERYFWNHAYRHVMRDAPLGRRRRIFKAILQARLRLDGTSRKHDAIIGAILKMEQVR